MRWRTLLGHLHVIGMNLNQLNHPNKRLLEQALSIFANAQRQFARRRRDSGLARSNENNDAIMARRLRGARAARGRLEKIIESRGHVNSVQVDDMPWEYVRARIDDIINVLGEVDDRRNAARVRDLRDGRTVRPDREVVMEEASPQEAPAASAPADAVEPEGESEEAQAEPEPRDISAQPTVPPPSQGTPVAEEPADAVEPAEESEEEQAQPPPSQPEPVAEEPSGTTEPVDEPEGAQAEPASRDISAQPAVPPPLQSGPAAEEPTDAMEPQEEQAELPVPTPRRSYQSLTAPLAPGDNHPNTYLLNRALDTYRDAMASFIVAQLGRGAGTIIRRTLDEPLKSEYQQRMNDGDIDLEDALRIGYFPILIRSSWMTRDFASHFNGDIAVLESMEQIAGARERGRWPGTDDLPADEVRQILELVSDLLERIGEADLADDVNRLGARLQEGPLAPGGGAQTQASSASRAAVRRQSEAAGSSTERAEAAKEAPPPGQSPPPSSAVTPVRPGSTMRESSTPAGLVDTAREFRNRIPPRVRWAVAGVASVTIGARYAKFVEEVPLPGFPVVAEWLFGLALTRINGVPVLWGLLTVALVMEVVVRAVRRSGWAVRRPGWVRGIAIAAAGVARSFARVPRIAVSAVQTLASSAFRAALAAAGVARSFVRVLRIAVSAVQTLASSAFKAALAAAGVARSFVRVLRIAVSAVQTFASSAFRAVLAAVRSAHNSGWTPRFALAAASVIVVAVAAWLIVAPGGNGASEDPAEQAAIPTAAPSATEGSAAASAPATDATVAPGATRTAASPAAATLTPTPIATPEALWTVAGTADKGKPGVAWRTDCREDARTVEAGRRREHLETNLVRRHGRAACARDGNTRLHGQLDGAMS